ncbi:hypothetical protein CL656_05155 [bacterium]|nr:hypothetical protein [bacterium]|tara:strand:- start:724 stop:2529 length:1806 start_codon:yes stop_codon:yes gene_type:complete
MINIFLLQLRILNKAEKRLSFLAIIAMIVAAMIEVAGVASIMPLVAVLGNPELIESNILLSRAKYILGIVNYNDFILVLSGLFLSFLFLNLFVQSFTYYLYIKFITDIEYNIGLRLAKNQLNKPYSWYLNINTSQIGRSILSQVGQVVHGSYSPMLFGLSYLVSSLFVVVLLFFIDPLLAFYLTFAASFSYLILYKILISRVSRKGKIRDQSDQKRYFYISETFSSIKELKSRDLESKSLKGYALASKDFSKAFASSALIQNIPRFVIEALALGGLICVIIYLIASRGGIGNALPVISVYAYSCYKLLPNINKIYSSLAQISFHQPQLKSLYNDLQYNIKSKILSKDNSQPKPEFNLAKDLVIDSLSYSYPQSSELSIDNLNLVIKKGSRVAFVGPTGSGKSTILDLILGLISPLKGKILIGEIQLSNLNLPTWRSNVSYVPQNIHISDTTIAENIAFGEDISDIDMNRVEESCRIARIFNFITCELQEQFNTRVGERGIRLSGGQRQRIGIARALYKRPSFILLDEATSALDNTTEELVISSIKKSFPHITIISVAHRIATIKDYDMIYVIEKGKITCKGTYDDLLITSKTFLRFTQTVN